MKKAITLVRAQDPGALELDAPVELDAEHEPDVDNVTVVFRGLRVPVRADAKILPLHAMKK